MHPGTSVANKQMVINGHGQLECLEAFKDLTHALPEACQRSLESFDWLILKVCWRLNRNRAIKHKRQVDSFIFFVQSSLLVYNRLQDASKLSEYPLTVLQLKLVMRIAV